MAFKQIPVSASAISGSHSDFPVYINPSVMAGWGSLTQAETDSLRFYADEAKTVELARECVSPTEIHVKVGTLSDSTTIYADYDGIRSDYAVGDTYGRNAVWGDYESVLHLNESSGDAIDSAGNGDFSVTDVVTGAVGKIGDGYNVDSSSAVLLRSNLGMVVDNTKDVTVQGWTKVSTSASLSNFPGFITLGPGGSSDWNFYMGANNSLNLSVYTRRANTSVFTASSVPVRSGTMDFLHGVRRYSNGTQAMYKNGSQIVSGGLGGSQNPANTSPTIAVGYWRNSIDTWRGEIDEVRIRLTGISDAQISTEYNNQNDVASFWGTVTDVGEPEPGATLGLKLGSTTINKVMLGSTEIKKVYLGTTVIYENL